MIRSVRVENYKSIVDLTLDLGRINVLIGANGSGKSNILEAIALGSAAAQYKLENEFLATRGIRVSETRFMRPSFEEAHQSKNIALSIHGDEGVDCRIDLQLDERSPYPKWFQSLTKMWIDIVEYEKSRGRSLETLEALSDELLKEMLRKKFGTLPGFLIYAPENSALRIFQAEGQILPLGIKGEGIFAQLKALNSDARRECLLKIKKRLMLMDWFEDFDIPKDLSRSIRIRDRYLSEGAMFDQRIANEGFLFLLFYFTLFISPDTPAFFSVDNVDSSLNPKLCSVLLQQLVTLAKEHDKQVIFTTHNPAILDGLDINDDEQRLFVVDRTKRGHSRVRRVEPPKLFNGRSPVNLSEAFMRGYFGGLPDNF